MRLREKGTSGDDGIVHLDWDQAQAALVAGTHESAESEGEGGERGSDHPAAQSPSAGSKPKDDDKKVVTEL